VWEFQEVVWELALYYKLNCQYQDHILLLLLVMVLGLEVELEQGLV
jgi:hypothetical protein